jgi:hypothetical protein
VHNKYTIGYPQGAALQRITEDSKKERNNVKSMAK